jgi:hypothetical protein
VAQIHFHSHIYMHMYMPYTFTIFSFPSAVKLFIFCCVQHNSRHPFPPMALFIILAAGSPLPVHSLWLSCSVWWEKLSKIAWGTWMTQQSIPVQF